MRLSRKFILLTSLLLVFHFAQADVKPSVTPSPSASPFPSPSSSPSPSSAMSYHTLEYTNKIDLTPDTVLSDKDVTEDIQETLYALDTAYSGKQYLPGTQFKDLEKTLQSFHGPLAVFELCKKIKTAFLQVSDSHLNAWVKDQQCVEPNKDATAGHVGENYFQSDERFWDVSTKTVGNSYALLISITAFRQHGDPAWNGLMESIKALLEKTQLVIIDLRGNGGGDDTKGYELSALLAGKQLKDPYQKQWTSPTPQSQQILLNAFLMQRWTEYDSQGKPVPEYLKKLIADFSEKREEALKGKLSVWRETSDLDSGAFDEKLSINKPIYILMDHACASSCESTIDAFEANKLVKKVGENTAGYIHFGNNGLVVLNHSTIRLQMATSYNSYKDGRFVEKKGITPDVKVPARRDAMDYAVNDFLAMKTLQKK